MILKNHCSSWRTSTGVPQRSQRPSITCSLASTVCVLGAPVDRGLLAVGQALLEQLQEEPLRPAVVRAARGCRTRASSRSRRPSARNWRAELRDRRLGRLARVLAGLDRVVLGRQAERVVAHRVQHAHAVAAAVVRDRVADRVDLQVADVRLADGVRAASRARSTRRPDRRVARWTPPRCARRPRPSATWASIASGRSAARSMRTAWASGSSRRSGSTGLRARGRRRLPAAAAPRLARDEADLVAQRRAAGGAGFEVIVPTCAGSATRAAPTTATTRRAGARHGGLRDELGTSAS